MEIRDVIHGTIEIEPHELAVLDSRHFQRLRSIKQLGFAEYAYPSATHNRYTHSLGAMFTAGQVFETIFHQKDLLDPKTFYAYRAIVRLAALLHDIGHGPLSHTSEMAMPPIESLELEPFILNSHLIKNRQATHEDFTVKILLDSSLTPLLQKAGEAFGFGAPEIAALIFQESAQEKSDEKNAVPEKPITPIIRCQSEFFYSRFSGNDRICFLPLLRQLISSELDADRMDYLRRDSFFTGVTYGDYDHHWLTRNLSYHQNQNQLHLCVDHRALYAFEDFLISRFHMFLMVYFHHKSVIYDEMLKRFFETDSQEYRITSDTEEYLRFTDGHLMQSLEASKNPWAKRITEKKPYRLLLETHSGLGELEMSPEKRIESLLNNLAFSENPSRDHSERRIRSDQLIQTTSTGQLSKYFGTPTIPLYVRYSDRYHSPEAVKLEQCTDLFERYREKRTIRRIYGPSL